MLHIYVALIVAVVQPPTVSAATPTPTQNRLQAAGDALQLLVYLSDSVDDCFNPSHPQANARIKRDFQNLAAKVQKTAVDIQANDRANMADDRTNLQSELNAFNQAAPFPANLYCGTRRGCLEAGFSANPHFQRCLPVHGDSHANPQYLAFEQLLDLTLPTLIAELRQAT